MPYPHHTVKFHSYGFGKASTEYLKDCLTLQKQNIKISKTFSNWINTVPGEPQGSTFGPLLFNVFFCGLFLFTPNSDLVSYGDDNTPFAMSSLAMELISKTMIAWQVSPCGFRIIVWKWIKLNFIFFLVIVTNYLVDICKEKFSSTSGWKTFRNKKLITSLL